MGFITNCSVAGDGGSCLITSKSRPPAGFFMYTVVQNLDTHRCVQTLKLCRVIPIRKVQDKVGDKVGDKVNEKV